MIDTVGGSANCLAPGVHIGEYRLLEVIGEGGFGIVYRARDISLDRIVAIKEYMPATLAGRKSSNEIHVRSQHRGAFDAGLRSFINEARLLAKFSHPALVHVYRFFEFNGTAYMVMRHYEGQTFRTFLSAQHGRMNQRMLTAIVSPILDVVEMLHAADCYHRDIAPDNVFLQNSGMPVLLDFGAARRIIGDMTQALTMVLKPGFAPIEQYVDDGAMPQGAWTDIYQIGAMLYLAITGKPPATSVARMINDPVAALTTAGHSGYSPQFLHGVHRALAVKPQDRPQTIAELKELLGITTFTTPMVAPWTYAAVPSHPTNELEHKSALELACPALPSGTPASTKVPAPEKANTAEGNPLDIEQCGKALSSSNTAATASGTGQPEEFKPTTSSSPINILKRVITSSNAVHLPHGAATPTAHKMAEEPRNTATPLAADADLVFPAQAPAQSAASLSARDLSMSPKTAANRWIAIAAVAIAATVMLAWWNGRDTSTTSQSVATSTTLDSRQWSEAQALGTIAAFDAYLKSQPEGQYRSEAFAQINRLESTEILSPAAEPVSPPSIPPATAATATGTPDNGTPSTPPTKPETTALAGPASAAVDTAPAEKASAKPAGDLGRVVLRISPWGRVSVNGNAIGTTPPLTQVELPEGSHRIEVSNPAAAPVIRMVQVRKGEPVVVNHQFE